MKSIVKTTAILLALFTGYTLQAQSKQKIETSFHVEGNCEMCKKRIETALMIPGIKYAGWDIDTQILTVIYRENKISLEEIHQKIAAAGHTTSSMEADSVAYRQLTPCCKYKSIGHH